MRLRDALAAALAHAEGDFVGKESVWTYRADAILSDPLFRASLVRIVTTALVETEEDKIGEHPECLTGTCDHVDGCPDWDIIGCGDGDLVTHHILTVDALPPQ